MKLTSLTWLGIAGCFTGFAALIGACGANDATTPGGGSGVCGNAVVDGTEECDDGNSNDADGCSNACTKGGAGAGSGGASASTGGGNTCGDSKLDAGEVCDDGNDVDTDSCHNNCTSNAPTTCGNAMVDAGEQCDDGNKIPDDACTNLCTTPICGDGIIQAGEACDDGKSNGEFGSKCPKDCKNPTMATSTTADPCLNAKVFTNYVTNNTTPSMQTGTGVAAKWSYSGLEGLQAGNAMCQAIGADHVCNYKEIVKAEAAGELTGKLPSNLTYWLHRTTSVVNTTKDITCNVDADCNGGTGAPYCDPGLKKCAWKAGAGGRCNDWTYPTGHISDGEWFATDQFATNKATGVAVGTLVYHFDGDTYYDGVSGAHLCSNSGVGCAGGCAGAGTRAILCCEPVCGQ